MPCCGRTPFEVPLGDRMSEDPAAVTCGAVPPAASPEAPPPGFGHHRALAALAAWHARVFEALYPPEIVFIVPNGTFRGFYEALGCKVIHADVDRPMVAIPVTP